MKIRTTNENDIRDVLFLIRNDLGYEEVQEDFVLSQLKKLQHDYEEVFIADVAGEAAGFIHVEVYSNLYFGPVGNILGLAIKSNYRRQGFASRLVQAAEEWTKEKGCIGMRLNSGRTRSDAHEFYRSQG